jgi:hypothetical protein
VLIVGEGVAVPSSLRTKAFAVVAAMALAGVVPAGAIAQRSSDGQQQPAMDVQTGMTVGHEDLLRTVEDDTSPTAPGGPRYVNNPPGVSPTS